MPGRAGWSHRGRGRRWDRALPGRRGL